MEHFRVTLETGKHSSTSRVLYVRAENIMDAYIVGNKVRYGKLKKVTPITYEEYMKGVDKKYSSSTRKL